MSSNYDPTALAPDQIPTGDPDVQAYRQDNTENGVLTTNVTQAKEMNPVYNASRDARTANGEAVHAQADQLTKAVYDDAIANHPDQPIVYDTHLRTDDIRPQIDQALQANRPVHVSYTLRDPVDAFENGYVKRT